MIPPTQDNAAATPQQVLGPSGHSPDEIRRRLQEVAGQLSDGKSPHAVVQSAVARWGVSRRTALRYINRARDRLEDETNIKDELFRRRLAQVLRDELLGMVFERLRQSGFLSTLDFARLTLVASRVLDGRTKASLQEEITKRADAKAERDKDRRKTYGW